MAEGVDGLLRDKTRPPGIAPIADHRIESARHDPYFFQLQWL